jgi:hypothetical protein
VEVSIIGFEGIHCEGWVSLRLFDYSSGWIVEYATLMLFDETREESWTLTSDPDLKINGYRTRAATDEFEVAYGVHAFNPSECY